MYAEVVKEMMQRKANTPAPMMPAWWEAHRPTMAYPSWRRLYRIGLLKVVEGLPDQRLLFLIPERALMQDTRS